MSSVLVGRDDGMLMVFSSLTNKLMVRVSNFFESQLNVPVRVDPNALTKKRRELAPLQPDMESRKRDKRQMTPDEMLSWYGKILEAVKMRYRKLQRFAWYVVLDLQMSDNTACAFALIPPGD